ncbi:response regulator [Paracraurococcus lichenis]|uniref:Response regulator n=1 Tax=Paracraurococcus lichenis TaxID=3064888 RepID=A0ABT9DYU0_9PROT|nr:response regulator [Paracraurococcus sp. LOR1-02]MDO9709075.1 response regulator [Paracraurococcus sp. LOR1-02]
MHGPLALPICNRLRGCRLLVVEDEALVAMLLEDELMEAGATVLGPDSEVETALRRIEATPGEIDLAVVDLNLKGREARPVILALVARGIPVIIATGYGAGRVPEAPDAPVLCKPFEGAKLVDLVCEVLRARGSAQQVAGAA